MLAPRPLLNVEISPSESKLCAIQLDPSLDLGSPIALAKQIGRAELLDG